MAVPGVPGGTEARDVEGEHAGGVGPVHQRVDATLAERSDRFTGADLEDLVRRAGLAALKRSIASDLVTMADFEAALKDTRASVTEAMERDYEKIQGEIKQQAMSIDPIGFFAPGMLKPVREQKHADDAKG